MSLDPFLRFASESAMPFHPVLHFLAALSLTALAFKLPFAQLRRLWAGLIVAFVWRSWIGIPELTSSPTLQSGFSLFLLVWVLHVLALLFIEAGTLCTGRQELVWSEVGKLLFDVRRIGQRSLEHQRKAFVNGKERGTTGTTKSPEEASILSFLKYRILRMCLCFAALYIYETNSHSIATTILNILHSATRNLSHASGTALQKVVLDLYMTLEFILSTFLFNNGFHSLFAVCAVGVLGLDTPEEWPLIWGSLTDVTSVRNFWGSYWHRLVARTFLAWSSVLLAGLKIDRRSAYGRRLTPILVFALSGCCHGLTSWLMGFRCGWWTDVAWFILQAVVMALEELLGMVGKSTRLQMSRIQRFLGCVWTWTILSQSISWWQSAKAQCMP
ncbi:uncharacterized protein AB675_10164 [Cyphellophora attinorum]|uniref:Wax synthase domain-containing protein n=1 Tax=Cyphellophora attinorum TaxID=1664694 RepID=A0A0N0NI06_9EURO|nr:uncharacterized protein AB675_10164 [Phialophora attinorum]KPI35168.1 hypothetical protein AB675_10164 [Phialophora attinorum]